MKRILKVLARLVLIFAIVFLALAIPTQAESSPSELPYPQAVPDLTYTGYQQVGVQQGKGYTLSGTWSAIDVGNYNAIATPWSGYIWAETGNNLPIDISWSIARQPIPVPSIPDQVFDNTMKAISLSGQGYTVVGGTIYGMYVDTYTIQVMPKSSYTWLDGRTGTININWRIIPLEVTPPVPATQQVYIGSLLSAAADGPNYTLSGLYSATDVGTYGFNAVLRDPVNTRWTGGSSDSMSFTWTIVPKPIPLPVSDGPFIYDGTTKIGVASREGVSVSNGEGIIANTYTAAVALASENYVWENGSLDSFILEWVILPKSVSGPAASGPFTYDGTLKSGVIDGEGYTVSGGTGTNAENYIATAELLGRNYVWDNGTVNPITVPWSILCAPLPEPAFQPNMTYAGSLLTPDVVMVNPNTGDPLTAGTDYLIFWTGNYNAGVAAAIVTGQGNWMGTLAVTFTILPAPLPAPAPLPDVTYTGLPFTPDLTMVNITGLASLVRNVDYTLAYQNNVSAGTATVTATGKGNWTGSQTVTFAIQPAQLPAPATLLPVSYTGEPITPEVSMANPNTHDQLVKDTDYTLAYENNLRAGGAATVIVTGNGNYAGRVSVSFTILFSPLPTPESLPSVTYTGLAFTPDVVIINPNNGARLVKDEDYLLNLSAHVNAGTTTVTATGWGSWYGTAFVDFTIHPAPLPAPDPLPDVIYTGLPFSRDVMMINPNTNVLLVKETDYTLVYSENINAGTATVTVTGIGDYTGTDTSTFSITSASLPPIAQLPDRPFTGLPFTPDVVMVNPNTSAPLAKDTDYTLAYSSNVNTGTAAVTVTGIGNYTGTCTGTFAITPAALPPITPLPDVMYNGLPFTPDVVITNPNTGAVLVKDTDYTLAYSANINAGSATVTVTGVGNWMSTATVAFLISEPGPSPTPTLAPTATSAPSTLVPTLTPTDTPAPLSKTASPSTRTAIPTLEPLPSPTISAQAAAALVSNKDEDAVPFTLSTEQKDDGMSELIIKAEIPAPTPTPIPIEGISADDPGADELPQENTVVIWSISQTLIDEVEYSGYTTAKANVKTISVVIPVKELSSFMGEFYVVNIEEVLEENLSDSEKTAISDINKRSEVFVVRVEGKADNELVLVSFMILGDGNADDYQIIELNTQDGALSYPETSLVVTEGVSYLETYILNGSMCFLAMK